MLIKICHDFTPSLALTLMSRVAATMIGFSKGPFEVSASWYEVAVAAICMDDSANALEADLISATAACVAALTTSASLSTTQTTMSSAAMPSTLACFGCAIRSATMHTASLATCDKPRKSEIWTRAPASMSEASISSGSIN